MQWKKRGRIFEPLGQHDWMKKYGILPSPIYLAQQNIIRVFFATSELDNIARVTYMDVDADNPSNILTEPQHIVLSEGVNGSFDDCGVNPNQVIFVHGKPYLLYSGYERTVKLPYRILSGMVALNDELTEVISRPDVPILDRIQDEIFIRSAMVAAEVDGVFHFWYVSAHGWSRIPGEVHNNKLMPNYCIKHGTTLDFKTFNITQLPAISAMADNEFGFGRPWVVYRDGMFRMWYSVRRSDKPYSIGYAESTDGMNWTRLDNMQGLETSDTGWDSEMMCYAAVVHTKNKTYLFHNGNNNGATGFGYAELMN